MNAKSENGKPVQDVKARLRLPNGNAQIHTIRISGWHVKGYVHTLCLEHGGVNEPTFDIGSPEGIALGAARDCYRRRKLPFWRDRPTV
jgi:hypothetical protein